MLYHKKSSFAARGSSGDVHTTKLAHHHRPHKITVSPTGALLRNIGPTETSWNGKHVFNAALSKIGADYYGRVNGSSFAPVLNGQNIADAYYNNMNNVYNFIRTGQSLNAAGAGMGVSKE